MRRPQHMDGPPPGPDRALRILEGFGISRAAVESVEPIVPGSQHQTNRVRTVDGDWVLKEHSRPGDPERTRMAHQLELTLEEGGFPVAGLGRTDAGQTLVQEGGASYSLHRWVHGRQVSIQDREGLIARDPDLVPHLAATLGDLHRISHSLGPAPAGVGVQPDRLLRAPRHAVRALRRPRRSPPLLPRLQALRLKRGKSEFDRWILHVLPDIAARAQRLSRRTIPQSTAQAMGLIHNDLNWGNLVLDERHRIRAVIDFDNATYAPWALEVGSAAVVFAGAERVDQFVGSYEDAARTTVDREVVGLAMEMKCVQSILNTFVSYLDGDTDLTQRGPWCLHLYSELETLGDRAGWPKAT